MSTANAMMSLVQSVFVLVATGFSGVFVPLELRNKISPFPLWFAHPDTQQLGMVLFETIPKL